MGSIKRFNLKNYIDKYNLTYFIETGTFLGESIDFSLNFEFKKILSMEIMKNLFEKAKSKYKENARVDIFLGDTSKNFSELLLNIPSNNNCLFWLDAHLPTHYGMSNHEITSKETVIPLEKELEEIKKIVGVENNVFLIDDLRIYEDGPFSNGNWFERKIMGGEGIKFIENIFQPTHTIEKNYSDEGYIIICPKK